MLRSKAAGSRSKNGRITKLGQGEFDASGAEAIDVKGAWITPGLVDANTSLGLPSAHENEQSDEVTPQIRVLDAVDPESNDFRKALAERRHLRLRRPRRLQRLRRHRCRPQDRRARTCAQRIVKDESGLRMTLGGMASMGNGAPRFGTPTSIYNRRPTTRMGVIWEVRNAFYKAMQSRGSGKPVKLRRDKLEVLLSVLDRKMVVRTTARQEHDIRTAIRLAKEFGIDIVLDGASESYYVLDYIVAAKVPVVLTPPTLMRDMDGSRMQLDTAAQLAKKGVPIALQTGQGVASLALVHEAAFAVRHGLPRQAALEAITSVPARILGVEDRVGTLAEGRDADIVVWSDHPLRQTTRVRHVFVDGQERELR